MWSFPLFPESASTTSSHVDALFFFELAVVAFFTLLILVLILFLAIRYRRGAKVDRSHPPTHGKLLEATWIGIPLILSVIMFVWSADVFSRIYTPPGDAEDIYVIGKQWMWKAQHPEGKSEINELHVPVGRPVRLVMTSQDVIHSFFIPAFRTKQDVLPGRYTTLWFEPTKVGKYHLFCAEYCGTNHSLMVGSVHVMAPADYERWLTEGQRATMAQEGQELFVKYHCAGCHVNSEVVRAPRLDGLYGRSVPVTEGTSKEPRFVRADDRYIRDSILMPKAQIAAGYEPVMPPYLGQIGEEDLLKLVEYIKSLGAKGTPR